MGRRPLGRDPSQMEASMAACIVNGRRVDIPNAATPEEVASAAGIRPGRRIIRQTREGNYPMNPGERVTVGEADKFVDAPQRVKGS
jgi:hypothetical protein